MCAATEGRYEEAERLVLGAFCIYRPDSARRHGHEQGRAAQSLIRGCTPLHNVKPDFTPSWLRRHSHEAEREDWSSWSILQI